MICGQEGNAKWMVCLSEDLVERKRGSFDITVI